MTCYYAWKLVLNELWSLQLNMLRLLETEANTHVEGIEAGTNMSPDDNKDAWVRMHGGLRSAIQACGSYAPYGEAQHFAQPPQASYQQPVRPPPYYGALGMSHWSCLVRARTVAR